MLFDNIYFDSMNIFFRYHFGLPEELGSIGKKKIPIQGVSGSLRFIRNMCEQHLQVGGKAFICSDNYTSRIGLRKMVDPAYKEGRVRQSPAFYQSLKALLLVLLNYRDDFFFVQLEGLEADDVVNPLIKLAPPEETHLLVSSDFDWARSIKENVSTKANTTKH